MVEKRLVGRSVVERLVGSLVVIVMDVTGNGRSPGNIKGPFLNAECNLLESRGWKLNKVTDLWMPPGG